MAGLFSSPSPPKTTPSPKRSDKAVQQAAAEAARKRRNATGFRSTILSKQFLSADSPALKTQLGA